MIVALEVGTCTSWYDSTSRKCCNYIYSLFCHPTSNLRVLEYSARIIPAIKHVQVQFRILVLLYRYNALEYEYKHVPKRS
jgi:hypothetical protein